MKPIVEDKIIKIIANFDFNTSISTGKVPSSLKIDKIVPIFKKRWIVRLEPNQVWFQSDFNISNEAKFHIFNFEFDFR